MEPIDLLRGLETLPVIGVPGRVIVDGESASAVLTGENPADVLIGTSKLGAGRVLVIAHEGYLVGFAAGAATDGPVAQLHRNIRQWATGCDDVVKGDVCVLDDVTRFIRERAASRWGRARDRARCKIALWVGAAFDGVDVVTDYVVSGGVLVHAVCPREWLQLHPGKTLAEMPLAGTLRLAGLGYSPDYSAARDTGYCIARSWASEAHVEQLIDQCIDDPQKLWEQGGVLCECLSRLPYDVQDDLELALGYLYERHIPDVEQLAPSPQTPLCTQKDKALATLCDWMKRRYNYYTNMLGIDIFPGDFTCYPPTMYAEMEIKSHLRDYHATGYYLPAGHCLGGVVVMTPLDAKATWTVSVGCHRDVLGHVESQRRWPNIVVTESLIHQHTSLASSYGGLIYMESPDGGGTIRFELEFVVEAPYFDLTNPTSVVDWHRRRSAPGLWADISGEHITITLPASSVRHVDDPSDAIATWDRVVASCHDLRGTDPRQERRMWVVTDEQPSVGYMHAGSPIVTHLDVADPTSDYFLLDAHMLRTRGSWGLFHEIGHNMQRDEWTFHGTVEVTCNVFTLYAMHVIAKRDPWTHECLRDQFDNIRAYLCSGAPFEECWERDDGVALGVYAQLAHHFGWRCYAKVFREYEVSRDRNDAISDEDKRTVWVRRFSVVARYNLCPLMEFWRFPLTDAVQGELSHLQPFLPDDEMTNLAPERVKSILAHYDNVARAADSLGDTITDLPAIRQPSTRLISTRLR